MSLAFSRIVKESIPACLSMTPTAIPENPVPTITMGKFSVSLLAIWSISLFADNTIGETLMSSSKYDGG